MTDTAPNYSTSDLSNIELSGTRFLELELPTVRKFKKKTNFYQSGDLSIEIKNWDILIGLLSA
jgi:hypothetical protein